MSKLNLVNRRPKGFYKNDECDVILSEKSLFMDGKHFTRLPDDLVIFEEMTDDGEIFRFYIDIKGLATEYGFDAAKLVCAVGETVAFGGNSFRRVQ